MIGASAIISGVKWAAVLAVITLVVVTYRQQVADARNMRDSLITVNAEKISEQARAQELENANVILQSVLTISLESAEESRIAVEALNEHFAEFRIESDAQKNVFDEHNLQNLANKKRGLIEKLSNKATKERFNELESLFNE